MIEKHDLHHEFPEHRERIQRLKENDRHFLKLFNEYNELDRRVRRMELDIEPVSDFFMEEQKKKRVLLKDQLYRLIILA